MILKWPEKAKRAISIFYVKWNDIDVYVEDTAKHAKSMYISLLNNALKGNCKIENVFPLGDKVSVISACEKDQIPGGRPRIYLVDGDIDLIATPSRVNLDRLFSHRLYAVENYFFCENAILELIHEENSQYSLDEIKNIFNFYGFLESIQPIYDLFLWFGITKRICPSLPTIGLGLGMFLDANKNCLDADKVREFCSQRENELLVKVNQKKINRDKIIVKNNIEKFTNAFDVVAAREYLFPLLTMWRSSKGLKMAVSKDSMQMRLAKKVNLERHLDLSSALRRAASS